MSKKSILAIGAHPDDMEQFAGGTLIQLVKKGHKVTIAPLTAGECGTSTLSANDIVKVRAKEQKKAAEIIGADYINLGIRDGCLPYDLETCRKVVALIRETKPTIIITHPTTDYMSDHAHAGQLVIWAVQEAVHKNFQAPTEAKAMENHPYVYHTDPQGLVGPDGQIARVNTVVDITQTIEQKLKAFGAHESQIDFLPNKINAVEKTRRWAQTRGEQAGIAYGEGFCQNLLAQYPRKNILVQILKDKVYTL